MLPPNLQQWTSSIIASLNANGYDMLRPELILAIIARESSGDRWALNAEPRYQYLWDVKQKKPFRKMTSVEYCSAIPPDDFPTIAGDPDQEWTAQRCSWGLMQVMGAVAREHGFRGNYLTTILEPYMNIDYGIRHLWLYCYEKGNNSTTEALKRWNGGGNPNYVDEVLTLQNQILSVV